MTGIRNWLLVTVLLIAGPASCTGTATGDGKPAAPAPGSPTASASALPRAHAEPALLLPNMHSLPAEDVQIRGEGSERELRFTAALANTGKGPLVTVPRDDPDCAPDRRHASQVIMIDDDGDGRFDPRLDRTTKTVPAGCMVDHPTHEHWHFDATASYVLTRPGAAVPVAATEKVSFCLRDSRRLPGAKWAAARRHYDECDRDSVQGITAGYADVYDTETDGQSLPLAGVPDGLYCLTLTADPQGLLRETVDDDNAATIGVHIVGDRTTAAPSAPACARDRQRR